MSLKTSEWEGEFWYTVNRNSNRDTNRVWVRLGKEVLAYKEKKWLSSLKTLTLSKYNS